LAPPDVLAEFPELDLSVKLRGEEGSEIGAVVDIGTAESDLSDVLEEWVKRHGFGHLPPEVYEMDPFEVADYLRGLMGKAS
jgi:hypothetical protein